MNNKNKYIKVISFLTATCILLAVLSAVSMSKLNNYKLVYRTSVERSLNELTENLDSITVSLQKGCYCSSAQSLSSVASQLNRSAACAKSSLEQLSDNMELTDEIYKFLSQVGDYTQGITVTGKETLEDSHSKSVKELYKYSQSLSDSVNSLRQDYLDGMVSLEKAARGSTKKSDKTLLSDSISDAGQAITDYPVLTYDGPFSDSRLKKSSSFLKNKNEITAQEAKNLTAEYLEKDSSKLRRDSDENGKIELFCFSSGEKSAAITKRGGYLCYITNPDNTSKAEISEKEAVRRAKGYLTKIGYDNMQENYYSTYDGVCTINFAYTKDGVTYYPDLIKVSVALDSGNISAVDARSYLMNHDENRSLQKIKLTEKEARSQVKSGLTVLSSKLALIPTDYEKEKLCYELHCKDSDNQEVLIYKNVESGKEESILILLISENGTLTK